MNPEAVFTRYDIRGDYPEEINEEFARRLGRAVGTYARRNGRGKTVVGRDTRDASAAVHPAFVDGARSTGANVVDVGEGPTDRVALAASHYGGTGVMITASHHAWERTGFKLIYEQGNGFSNDDLDTVKDLFRNDEFEDGDGSLLDVTHEFDETYRETLIDTFAELVDGEIDASVLVDTSGAAGPTAADVLDALGADVTQHDWEEPPAPEPREENRKRVIEKAAGFDAAVGYDPDGDRVYFVHPEIGWVDGDRIFYALAKILEPERITASIDTGPMIDEVGADIDYTRVGDIFVAEHGIANGAGLIGEPNGHYGIPSFCWYNSGIMASLLLVSAADRIPSILGPVADYRTMRESREYSTEQERDAVFEQVKKQIAKNYDVVSRIDGVKFEGDGVTGLVRPSGTSPKLRVVVHTTATDVDIERILEELF